MFHQNFGGGFGNDDMGPGRLRTYAARSSTFTRDYRAFSVLMMPGQERPDVNAGGKIIMPPSSLESLSRLNISFPMLFKVENKAKGRFIIPVHA
jgi:hypothetical protein